MSENVFSVKGVFAMLKKKNVRAVLVLLFFISAFSISCGDEKKKRKGTSEAEKSLGRGNSYYKLYKYDSAIKAYEDAIKYDPSLKMAHHNLAIAYAKKERYSDAIHQYEEYLKLADKDHDHFEIEKVEKRIKELKKKTK